MASIDKLIKEKTKRLTSVPDRFLTDVEKIQKTLYPEIVELLKNLDTDKNGNIIINNNNLKITANLKQEIKDVIEDSEYVSAVNEFVLEFEDQAKLTDQLVSKGFDEFSRIRNVDKLLELNINKTKDVLIGSIADTSFADAISNEVELAIANNSSYSETLQSLQTLVTGDDKLDGKLLQYAKQVAHDQFAISDRSYTSAVADSISAEWFFYSGSEIETTRPFCSERHNRYFHYKEISIWGNGGATEGMLYPDGNGNWAGKIPGTNTTTIYSTAGGYNCRHSIIPVSIEIVPEKDIQRAIDQGFYKPNATKKEEASDVPMTDDQLVEEIENLKLSTKKQKEFEDFYRFKLSDPQDAKLQDLSIKQYIVNKKELLDRLIEASPKRIVNTDDARKMFIPLGYKGINAAAVHRASSELSYDLENYFYNQIEKGKGKIGLWAGGPGSGKTSTIGVLRPSMLRDLDFNIDGTLANTDYALDSIKKMLADGNRIEVPYIFSDPEQAWRNVIERTIYNKSEMGRIVPKSVFIKATKGAYETITSILETEEIINNPNFALYPFDNRYGYGRARQFTISQLNNITFKSNLDKILDDITFEYYNNGLLTEEQYKALIQ